MVPRAGSCAGSAEAVSAGGTEGSTGAVAANVGSAGPVMFSGITTIHDNALLPAAPVLVSRRAGGQAFLVAAADIGRPAHPAGTGRHRRLDRISVRASCECRELSGQMTL